MAGLPGYTGFAAVTANAYPLTANPGLNRQTVWLAGSFAPRVWLLAIPPLVAGSRVTNARVSRRMRINARTRNRVIGNRYARSFGYAVTRRIVCFATRNARTRNWVTTNPFRQLVTEICPPDCPDTRASWFGSAIPNPLGARGFALPARKRAGKGTVGPTKAFRFTKRRIKYIRSIIK